MDRWPCSSSSRRTAPQEALVAPSREWRRPFRRRSCVAATCSLKLTWRSERQGVWQELVNPGSARAGKVREGEGRQGGEGRGATELWLWLQRLPRLVPPREIVIPVLTPRISKQDILPVAVNGCEGHRSGPPELSVSGGKGGAQENSWKCVRLYFVTGTPQVHGGAISAADMHAAPLFFVLFIS